MSSKKVLKKLRLGWPTKSSITLPNTLKESDNMRHAYAAQIEREKAEANSPKETSDEF